MVESAAVLQGQLIAAQSGYAVSEQIYTGNNVRVRSLRARVEELKRQAQNLQGNGRLTRFRVHATRPDVSIYPKTSLAWR